MPSSRVRCPKCGGHGQDFLEDYDTVRGVPIVIHLDRGCVPCNGTGYVEACRACEGQGADCRVHARKVT